MRMRNPFKKTYTPKEVALFEFLSRVKLFELLSHEELDLFRPYLYLRKYKEDEVVFFRNDPSHAFYIVKKGQVSLNIDIQNKFEVLTLLGTGKGFGDNVMIQNTKRIYSAVVISEEAEIYVVPQVNIYEIFNSHIEIRAKMLTSLAEVYNGYTQNLFKAYRSSNNFFNLSQVYAEKQMN